MKTENRTFKHKNNLHHGTIVWPDDLSEAVTLLGRSEVWDAFKLGYLEICRRQICGLTPRRRKTHKIDLSDLPEGDQEMISQMIRDLKEQYQQLQRERESALLESQHTDQTDYDETPEAAQDPASESVDSFESDFAIYSNALGSSLPPHTETL